MNRICMRLLLLMTLCLSVLFGNILPLFPVHSVEAVAVKKPGWQIAVSPHPGAKSSLKGVAAIASNDVWAVGSVDNQTLTEHWDGNLWSVVSSPNLNGHGELTSVTAIASNDVWTAGQDGSGEKTLLEHWDGTSWSIDSSGFPLGYLFSITAIASNDIWAVGRDDDAHTLAEHWNGSSWTRFSTPSFSFVGNYLFAVAAVSSNDVWAVGEDVKDDHRGYTLTEHWDGRTWSVFSDEIRAGSPVLYGVTTLPTGEVYAVGVYTPKASNALRSYVQVKNDQHWDMQPAPSINNGTTFLSSAVALSPQNIWAVGVTSAIYAHPATIKSLIANWDGSSWKFVPGPLLGTFVALTGIVAIPGTHQLITVGHYEASLGAAEQSVIETYA